MSETLDKNLKKSNAVFSNDKFEIFVLASNIFKVKPRLNAELDVEDGKKIRTILMKLSVNKSYAILGDGTNYFTSTSELRQLMASKEFTDLRFGFAIVTRSIATKIVGNFFIKVNKPASPTRIFDEEASALEWLKQLSNSCR
jgi:hypothetical protein